MNTLLQESLNRQPDMPRDLEENIRRSILRQKEERTERSGKPRERRGVSWRFRPVYAALAAVLVLGTVSTAMAAKSGSLSEFIALIWGGESSGKQDQKASSQTTPEALEKCVQENLYQLTKDVKIEKVEFSYEKIGITPVTVITDNYVSYAVVRVTGKNGFRVTKDMCFAHGFLFPLEEDEVRETGSGQVRFLKEDSDGLYYCIRTQYDSIHQEKNVKLQLELGGFAYVEGYDEKGIPIQFVKEEEDHGHISYKKAAEGSYYAELSCNVQNKCVLIPVADEGSARIFTLGVRFTRDIFNTFGDLRRSKAERAIYVETREGDQVEVELLSGLEDQYTNAILETPVDLDDIRGIHMGKEWYPVEE